MDPHRLRAFLDERVERYNQIDFIEDDPICIPHQYSLQQDQEIAGFFAALFAWGHRTIIINKSKEWMKLMDNAPYDFVLNHTESDLEALDKFVHRTFNSTDLFWLLHQLQQHYQRYNSLEVAFSKYLQKSDPNIESALIGFKRWMFAHEDHPPRTKKHISSPETNSHCKRLNMFLRWMVRKDKKGVDFGIWKQIKPAQLICPIDVHVARVAHRLQLLHRKQVDWKAALELTDFLRKLDPKDPVKYDFALFGLGVVEKY